jgi:hypothetical protein
MYDEDDDDIIKEWKISDKRLSGSINISLEGV